MTEREIFLEATEMAMPESRATYLQAACGADVTLRRRVEELLKEHFSTDNLLAGPAVEDRPDIAEFPAGEVPAQMIDRYKLLEKIGEGGCGVVYVAEQTEPVRRRVAIKIIKLGMDTKSVVARFEAERQALAMMDHPNIAKVLDAGSTATGRPYFVMELVRGMKMTEYCDEAKLSTGARLDLFIEVCQAIQHAHQKGIIHRDIKPSNILVTVNDGAAVPKVIDFGIAKATSGQQLTDKTIYTAFEQFIGTPAYMSPEQAVLTSLDIDTRSDIYALGVLLYELLTGQTPFDAKQLLAIGLDEMRRTIREQEPPPPSSRLSTLTGEDLTTTAQRRGLDAPKLVSELRGDLDWIVMKCLEKDRTRRYETANGLVADIQRYLADEPIVARPPSTAYKLKKTWQRNKVVVTAGAFVAVVLVAGIIGTTLALFEADRQRDLVEGQRKELTERNRALQAARDRERLVNEKMIEFYTDSTQEPANTEEERSRQAQAYRRLGRMHQILDRPQESENAYLRAVALGRQLAADFPHKPEFRLELASSHADLGLLLRRAYGRTVEVESAYGEAATILRKLAAEFPTERSYRQGLAGVQNNLGNLLFETGRIAEAESVQAEAMAIRKQLVADFPKDPDPTIRRALAQSHSNVGWSLHSSGRLKEAESAYRDGLAIQKQVAADFSNPPEFRSLLAKIYTNLGNVLHDMGRLKESQEAHDEALVIYKQLIAEFPDIAQFREAFVDAKSSKARPPGVRTVQLPK
jgi:serine/threonine protein kinase/tetratricopeptide (TPR) repeat protein